MTLSLATPNSLAYQQIYIYPLENYHFISNMHLTRTQVDKIIHRERLHELNHLSLTMSHIKEGYKCFGKFNFKC